MKVYEKMDLGMKIEGKRRKEWKERINEEEEMMKIKNYMERM